MNNKYVSIRTMGASEKSISQMSRFLNGAHTWGCDSNHVVYASVSEGQSIPVAIEGDGGKLRILIEECNQAMNYHIRKH